MIVAYCANRAIYSKLPTAINSLLTNNEVEKIYLLIEDDEIKCIKHPNIFFINCNQFDFLIRDGFNVTKRFPYMAMVRCFLTKILSEDKVLYLDVDTVVDSELSELWKFNLGSNCIAARNEYDNIDVSNNRTIEIGYFNSGVMLMNLKLIKHLGLDDRLITLLKGCHFVFPDQDAMNYIFKSYVSYLPHKFNAIGGDHVYEEDLAIRHYAGVVKPWKENATDLDKAIWEKYQVPKI